MYVVPPTLTYTCLLQLSCPHDSISILTDLCNVVVNISHAVICPALSDGRCWMAPSDSFETFPILSSLLYHVAESTGAPSRGSEITYILLILRKWLLY